MQPDIDRSDFHMCNIHDQSANRGVVGCGRRITRFRDFRKRVNVRKDGVSIAALLFYIGTALQMFPIQQYKPIFLPVVKRHQRLI